MVRFLYYRFHGSERHVNAYVISGTRMILLLNTTPSATK